MAARQSSARICTAHRCPTLNDIRQLAYIYLAIILVIYAAICMCGVCIRIIEAEEKRRRKSSCTYTQRGAHISGVRCYCRRCRCCALLFFSYCYYIFLCLYDRMCFDKRRLVSAWKLRKIGRERSASTFRVFISRRKFVRFYVPNFCCCQFDITKC